MQPFGIRQQDNTVHNQPGIRTQPQVVTTQPHQRQVVQPATVVQGMVNGSGVFAFERNQHVVSQPQPEIWVRPGMRDTTHIPQPVHHHLIVPHPVVNTVKRPVEYLVVDPHTGQLRPGSRTPNVQPGVVTHNIHGTPVPGNRQPAKKPNY